MQDNIAYGMMIEGKSVKVRRRAAEEMLEMVRLPGYGCRKAEHDQASLIDYHINL